MRKQDHLVQLIATLSPAEKRNFRQFSAQQGDTGYMTLFDALESEPHYNAGQLMKKLNLDSKQLRNGKYYLSQSLLKCLRNYEQPAVNVPVNRLVEISRSEISILLGRGLVDYALEMTNKTLELAMEYEMFDMANNLMAVKYICLHNLERFDELNEAFFDERERLARVATEYRTLHRINCIVAQAERKREVKSSLDKIPDYAIMKQKPETLQSLVAQEAWFDIMFKFYTIKKERVKALETARLQWKLYDKHKSIRRIAPFIWAKSYLYLIEAEAESGSAKKAIELLHKFDLILQDKAKPVLSKGTTQMFKAHLYALNLAALFKLKRFKELIKEAESPDSPALQRPLYEQFLILLSYSVALMHEKQSDKAIIKLNELLQLNAQERQDLQPYIRPAIILCQLQLGNYQVVPYLIKSAKAWMKRQKINSREIDLFFSLAYSIAKAPAFQKPQAWTKLQQTVATNKLTALNRELHLSHWMKRKDKR
ncbi:MAG: hypothetical protein JWO06_1093 [Bacteroidota bacterium]|nr:hypothetical protein [Bacteroidota bacterium]